MRLLVIGSRGIANKKEIFMTLDRLRKKTNIDCLISGGAIGVDSIAEEWARDNSIKTVIKKPNWSIGKQAGILRNIAMVEMCDYAVIFWDGKSRGTKFSIDYLEKKNKRYTLLTKKA